MMFQRERDGFLRRWLALAVDGRAADNRASEGGSAMFSFTSSRPKRVARQPWQRAIDGHDHGRHPFECASRLIYFEWSEMAREMDRL
ncbi:hypothetical protein A5731_02755 [Mycolicibacterium conceptionense]|jgi:hypothetical protein|uniref:Uncharacterized protein n=2 Tax=Mycolicibacterium TaxID=1866885 RepID=A0A0J8U066_9MYCO|nr:hypothetical protein AA982_05850 [Mycolicibacterium senegalense]KMV15048.1 hypothetical protein ACT17_27135 [Mycolicibacterium conceptionense]KLO52929.1 hypothetical protein ABW05_16905 [Mycolicibacterium senegalense]OBB10087.1 hypothetical protein A5718_09205 [Mycolicibacterium conceptionense]OBF08961.1 hypothetical protein A5731_02755 [Mycolicibacterium conceptionense]